jgi:hypothetical protein
MMSKNINKLVVSLALIGLLSCSSRTPIKTGLEGRPIPSFNLLLPDSNTYFIAGKSKVDKPVVLFYFLPDCPYCKVQIKEIIANIGALNGIQFYFITPAEFSKMKFFYMKYQLEKYGNIIVGVDYSNFINTYFRASQVPYVAIYGKARSLKEVYVGNLSAAKIRSIAEE